MPARPGSVSSRPGSELAEPSLSCPTPGRVPLVLVAGVQVEGLYRCCSQPRLKQIIAKKIENAVRFSEVLLVMLASKSLV